MSRRRSPAPIGDSFYQQVVESAPDAMLVVDEYGTIVFANRRCEALAGVARAELVGQSVEGLVPAGVRPVHPAHRSGYGADPRARPMGAGLDLRLVVADGTEVAVDISLSPVVHEGQQFVAAAIRDVSDRERAAQELRWAQADLERTVVDLRRSTELLVMASELSDLLHSCRTIDDAHRVLVRFGPRFFPGSSGAVYRSQAGGGELQLARSWGDAAPFDPTFSADDCWAFRRGRLHVRRADDDLPCDHLDDAYRSACVPMVAQGETLGVVVVGLGPAAPVPPDLDQRARSLGEHLSLALANIVLRETLRAQSIRDPLTGLYNRRFLEEHLQREVHRSYRSGTPIGLLSIDLDHFKRYNDDFGHGAGDAALLAVASMLRMRSRDEDVVCRQGGEEFLVVLSGADPDAAELRAEELRQACAALILGAGRSLTMSVGVACYPHDGASIEEVLAAVDAALYRAKHEGRDRVARADGLDRQALRPDQVGPSALPSPALGRE